MPCSPNVAAESERLRISIAAVGEWLERQRADGRCSGRHRRFKQVREVLARMAFFGSLVTTEDADGPCAPDQCLSIIHPNPGAFGDTHDGSRILF